MSKKYIIRWDAGYGSEYDEVEAESVDEANSMAYERWREDAENNADYACEGEATEELREFYL